MVAATYLNGRWPDSALAWVPGTNARVRADAAAQVTAFCQAFEARWGVPLVITDGYRPYEGSYYSQVDTMLRRYKPAAEFKRLTNGASTSGRKFHDWAGQRRYLLPGESQVSYPGKSNHGTGSALDLGSGVNVMDSERHRWAVANAPRFGLVWPAWARPGKEPWHFDVTGVVPVSRYVGVPGVDPNRLPIPGGTLPDQLEKLMAKLDEDDRKFIIDAVRGQTHAVIGEWVPTLSVNVAQVVTSFPVSRYGPNDRTLLEDIVDGTSAALNVRDIVDPNRDGHLDAPITATPGVLDEAALAQLMVPKLADLILPALRTLPEQQLQQIATAVNDEAHRRTAK